MKECMVVFNPVIIKFILSVLQSKYFYILVDKKICIVTPDYKTKKYTL